MACWQQACPVGRRTSTTARRAAAKTGSRERRLTPAPEGEYGITWMRSRNHGGPGVQALRTKARPWRLKFFRAQPPAHLCLLSVRTESRSPQGETWPRKAGTAFLTVSFGAIKRNGVGKLHLKGAAFGLCLLFARAKSRSPQGETLQEL